MKNIALYLKLRTGGIEIDNPPEEFKKRGEFHITWLKELEKKCPNDSFMSTILQNAIENLSIRTWQGIDSKGIVVRGTSKFPGGNYRLTMSNNNEKWLLVKLSIFNCLSYARVKPDFL